MTDPLLGPLLKGVSRSFYLSLRILPSSLSRSIGLAYLLARAADTLTDLPVLSPSQRLRALEHFRARLRDEPDRLFPLLESSLDPTGLGASEKELLDRLPDCFEYYDALDSDDRTRVCRLLMTLTGGMIKEVTVFRPENSPSVTALATRADLEFYTYSVAGCVGEFWTEMLVARCPACAGWEPQAMTRRGVRFGQGLQMINVLRDLPHDLRGGRCYLPAQDLATVSLRPEELLNPGAERRLRPLTRALLRHSLQLLEDGWNYLQAIPPAEPRLRLACGWPLFIGLKTLEELARRENLLEATVRVKISRRAVYRLLAVSSALVLSRSGLELYYRRLQRKARENLG